LKNTQNCAIINSKSGGDMRRRSDKEIKKEFNIFLILGIIAILFSIFIVLLPIMPTTPYEEYKEKEVIISEFDHFYGGPKGASYDYIITEDGEKYNVTGEYSRSELSEILIKGTTAVIKYDINDILPFKKYAEEITVGGNKIVTYNNDTPTKWTFHIIFCLIFCLIGVAFLFAFRGQIIRNRKLQAKRDARIIKKYGNLKK
jgi:predicted RND superfamily exporter protein